MAFLEEKLYDYTGIVVKCFRNLNLLVDIYFKFYNKLQTNVRKTMLL